MAAGGALCVSGNPLPDGAWMAGCQPAGRDKAAPVAVPGKSFSGSFGVPSGCDDTAESQIRAGFRAYRRPSVSLIGTERSRCELATKSGEDSLGWRAQESLRGPFYAGPWSIYSTAAAAPRSGLICCFFEVASYHAYRRFRDLNLTRIVTRTMAGSKGYTVRFGARFERHQPISGDGGTASWVAPHAVWHTFPSPRRRGRTPRA